EVAGVDGSGSADLSGSRPGALAPPVLLGAGGAGGIDVVAAGTGAVVVDQVAVGDRCPVATRGEAVGVVMDAVAVGRHLGAGAVDRKVGGRGAAHRGDLHPE